MFIFVSLFIGTALKHLGMYIKVFNFLFIGNKVPYTPILMIFGIALGISTKYIKGKMDDAID